jgi:cell division septum initiation protein DivIVA
MSVFEPHTEPVSNGDSRLPVLDVPLRGRKGQQVSAYIEELAARLDQQSARAERSEQATARLRHELDVLRNQPPPSFEHLGAEAAKVLEDAGQSAKVLLEQAKGHGRVIIEQARAHAAELVEAAEHDASTRLDAASQAAEQMLAKANGERSVIEAEARRLTEYRDSLLGHLGRVQADLAGFLTEANEAMPEPSAAEIEAAQHTAGAGGEPDTVHGDTTGQPAESAIAAVHAPQ